MLKIGDFSKLSRISIRMLRHYDKIGLLVPKAIDDMTSYRYYTEDQLPVASRIVALKDMGFQLSVIREILHNYDDQEALAKFLAMKQVEIQAEAEAVNRRLLLLDTAIKRLREDSNAMNYNVLLKMIPERYVASVRQVIPCYEKEGTLWGLMMQETASQRMQALENGNTLTLFHDDGYKEQDVDIEVQMTVKGTYQDTEHVVFKTEPAVEIASATYKGSYDQLTQVNQSVAAWVRDNGYEFDGNMFLIYHVSPQDTKDPEDYVTEVCFKVRKK